MFCIFLKSGNNIIIDAINTMHKMDTKNTVIIMDAIITMLNMLLLQHCDEMQDSIETVLSDLISSSRPACQLVLHNSIV